MSDPEQLVVDWDAIYRDRVLPALGVTGGGVADPRWIFVCGQPGSGKSTRVARLAAELGPDRTQQISGDALCALQPEIFLDEDDPAVADAFAAYGAVQDQFISGLVDRAATQGAHIVWESHLPSDMTAVAALARTLGYRVELDLLAVPPDESWLSSLERDSARPDLPQRGGASWSRHLASCHRWPSYLATVESEVIVDALRILDRSGTVLFENTAQLTGTRRRWAAPPFAMESLLVERLAPRSAAERANLMRRWAALRCHPAIAFRNARNWPYAEFMALGKRLRSQITDPSADFDLTAPAADPNGALDWLQRLEDSIAAAETAASTPLSPDFTPRARRLVALVRQTLAPILSP
jgi:adenylate kinase family enzyme